MPWKFAAGTSLLKL